MKQVRIFPSFLGMCSYFCWYLTFELLFIQGNVSETARRVQTQFGLEKPPERSTIRYNIKKMEEKHTVHNQHKGSVATKTSEEAVNAVRELCLTETTYPRDVPRSSCRRNPLNMSHSTYHCCAQKANLLPYKMKLTHEMREGQ